MRRVAEGQLTQPRGSDSCKRMGNCLTGLWHPGRPFPVIHQSRPRQARRSRSLRPCALLFLSVLLCSSLRLRLFSNQNGRGDGSR